jgi:hypothetical protein
MGTTGLHNISVNVVMLPAALYRILVVLESMVWPTAQSFNANSLPQTVIPRLYTSNSYFFFVASSFIIMPLKRMDDEKAVFEDSSSEKRHKRIKRRDRTVPSGLFEPRHDHKVTDNV